MTETVVCRPFVGIRQDVVRLGRFLEPLFGGTVSRIAVGVIGRGRFAVRALDLIGGGALGNPQHFVVIAFPGHGGC
jgi:hypothetical protein